MGRIPETFPIPRRALEPEERALRELAMIRATIERTSLFPALPGVGALLVGVIACPTTVFAMTRRTPTEWLTAWLFGALAAYVVGLVAIVLRAKNEKLSLFSRPARHFAVLFTTPHLAAMTLTAAMARAGQYDFLPAVWLLFYGTGAVAGGIVSDRLVSRMGAVFLVLGAAAAVAPAAWGDYLMFLGFGVMHVVAGVILMRRSRRESKA